MGPSVVSFMRWIDKVAAGRRKRTSGCRYPAHEFTKPQIAACGDDDVFDLLSNPVVTIAPMNLDLVRSPPLVYPADVVHSTFVQ